jgi:hypothetical protein
MVVERLQVTGVSMKREAAAYIAGIMDGEGSIYIERFKARRSRTSKRRNLTPYQYRICACLTMCDKKTMTFVAKTANRKIRKRRLPKRHSSGFRRTLVAYDIVWRNGFAEAFLRSILPYLHCKKRKAVLCLRFQETCAPGRGRPFQKRLMGRYEELRRMVSSA